MKKQIPAFIAGALTAVILCGITVTALAASNKKTIDVYPINIEVNGKVFQPKGSEGEEVPVFTYNGTTYAPLRALAEAYGLEVGYNAEKNLATVLDPDIYVPEKKSIVDTVDYSTWSEEKEAEYEAFKAMWEVSPREGEEYFDFHGDMAEHYNLIYKGNLTMSELRTTVRNAMEDGIVRRMAYEIREHDDAIVRMYFFKGELSEAFTGETSVEWYDGLQGLYKMG